MAEADTSTEDRIAALADKTLLLLDDDNALRTRLGRALESRGFEVTLAASLAEAREALKGVAAGLCRAGYAPGGRQRPEDRRGDPRPA